jgi:DNA-binding transcriptional LysR family regulator
VRPTLDQLEALLWISRLGSFRAAAQHLNVSQPAISGRIRELELQIGAPLFDRSQSRPRITRRGSEVVRYAEQITRLSAGLAARLGAQHALVGTFRMGVADSFAMTHLPALLTSFAQHHPAAQLELVIDFSVNLDRKLHCGELDVAILHAPTPGPAVVAEPLTRFALAWFASPAMKLPLTILRPEQLANVPILCNPRPSHLYASIIEWFGAAGQVPRRINTCTSLSIITRLVTDGFGIAVLPTTLVEPQIRSGLLRRMRTAPALSPSRLTVAYRLGPQAGDLHGIVRLAREVVGSVRSASSRQRRSMTARPSRRA